MTAAQVLEPSGVATLRFERRVEAGSVAAGHATPSLRVVPASVEPVSPLPVTPDGDAGADDRGVPEETPAETLCVESLVAAAVSGDHGARARLLAEIHPFVLRYCRGRLGRQETVTGSADDVAQEVCLAVVTALPNYTVKGLSFRAFVYGIAAHKVTDAFRAIGRNRSDPVADLPDNPVAEDGPEHHIVACELSERLGLLLSQLTPRQREVLVLRIAVGLSADETAHAVRSTPGAVRVTQHRALNRLRDLLGRNPADALLAGFGEPSTPAE